MSRVAGDHDGEFRHRGAERHDLAPAQPAAVGLDRALHDAPFAHAVLVDAAVVVDGVERALEDGIELDGVGGRDLRHPRRGHELDVQALVLEVALVAGDQHRQVVDRVHDRDLRLLRLLNIHGASSQLEAVVTMFCFAYWAVNGARLRATRAARYLEECLPKSEYWDVPVAARLRKRPRPASCNSSRNVGRLLPGQRLIHSPPRQGGVA